MLSQSKMPPQQDKRFSYSVGEFLGLSAHGRIPSLRLDSLKHDVENKAYHIGTAGFAVNLSARCAYVFRPRSIDGAPALQSARCARLIRFGKAAVLV
jgi:hypothetical protein